MELSELITAFEGAAASDKKAGEELTSLVARAERGDVDLPFVCRALGIMSEILDLNAVTIEAAICGLRVNEL